MKVQSRSDSLACLVWMVNIDTIVGVWSGHLLVTVSNAISISITWLSGSLAIGVVDVVTIRTMIVRAGLLDIRVTTAISITWLSRSLAISITAISSITITTISKRETLWRSVGVAGSVTTISWLSLGISLAITIGNVITVAVGSWISISIIRLGNTDGGRSITSIAIAWLSISLSIVSITSIPLDTLWASVIITTASISMVGNTTITISRLSSSKAGEGKNNR